jgi:hypothetical protein
MLSNPINTMVVLSESDQIWRNEIIIEVAKETRMPIQRVMMMTWAQFTPPNKIRTQTGREVELSRLTATALLRLPRSSKWMFSVSPVPPIIPDEYLDGARQFIRDQEAIEQAPEKSRKHLRIIFAK